MNGYDISVVISDGFEDVSAEVKRNTPELEAELDLVGGIPVENGATFIPSVSKEGVISWTNDKELPNPEPVNIKGAKGDDGASVTVKSVSESTADGGSNVVTFSDGKKVTIKNGKKGNPGADGYTPIKGIDYFDGKDGAPGRDGLDGGPGKDGADGYSPVRGKDYWTDADKAEIKSYVDEAILGGEW